MHSVMHRKKLICNVVVSNTWWGKCRTLSNIGRENVEGGGLSGGKCLGRELSGWGNVVDREGPLSFKTAASLTL